jgi:hypothetical protein
MALAQIKPTVSIIGFHVVLYARFRLFLIPPALPLLVRRFFLIGLGAPFFAYSIELRVERPERSSIGIFPEAAAWLADHGLAFGRVRHIATQIG